ncbi:MAG: hypothetical protein NT049_18665 [Planctomycetota bacterium]|nr:hypothetical protein [Planctomycetota bacterium]
MKYHNLIAGLVVALTVILVSGYVPGCHKSELPKQPPRLVETAAKADDAGDAIQKAADTAVTNIDGAAVKVNDVAGVVTTQADTLRKATPAAEPVAKVLDAQADALQNDVTPKLHVAREAVTEISRESKIVVQVIVPELKAADAAAQALAKDRDAWQAKAVAAEKRIAEEQAKADNAVRAVLKWLIIAGVGILAVGVFLAVKVDLKAGLAVSAGALLLVGAATLVHQYLEWIALGAGVLIAAAIGGIAWMLWRSRTAFFQTGNLVEAIKQNMDPESLKAVFGDGAVPGLVHQIVDDAQSALYQLGVKTGLIKTLPDPAPVAPLPATTATPIAAASTAGN